MLNQRVVHASYMSFTTLLDSINSCVFVIHMVHTISERPQVMGKFGKSGPATTKSRVFEATTRHTRRGPRIVNVPVENPRTPTSRNSSPSKKRAWSPGGLHDDDDGDLPSFQEPKRSRRTGKVGVPYTTISRLFNTFSQTQNAFLREYVKKRNGLLIELLRHESPPSNRTCTMCNITPGIYRCKDCFKPHILCAACCVSAHLTSPFHRIQQFNGQYFERSDLDKLGLVLDLRPHTHDCCARDGHRDSEEAPGSEDELSEWEDDDIHIPSNPSQQSGESIPIRSNLIIVTSTGIFKRSVIWCRCANTPKPYVQLLRAELFPASFLRPSTAFTFEVLDHFRIDALECKTAAMNFMSKIVRISNEAFPSSVPVGTLNFPALWYSVIFIGPLSRASSYIQTVEGPSQSHSCRGGS
jgi:hypothetical protein